MAENKGQERFGYDVFLSHNNAEKDWVRELAERLAVTDYNGRPLRPWLDEQVLDPGDLSGEQELTSAMDRSRFLVIVLSPGSNASPWVNFELGYFISLRGESGVLPILKEECGIPAPLKTPLIDFTKDAYFEDRFADLLVMLRPEGNTTPDQARDLIDITLTQAVNADPGGLWPDPTPERDTLLSDLMKFDIDAPADEGPAVAAITQASHRIKELNKDQAPSGYNMKMLLGECLAAGILRSPGYR